MSRSYSWKGRSSIRTIWKDGFPSRLLINSCFRLISPSAPTIISRLVIRAQYTSFQLYAELSLASNTMTFRCEIQRTCRVDRNVNVLLNLYCKIWRSSKLFNVVSLKWFMKSKWSGCWRKLSEVVLHSCNNFQFYLPNCQNLDKLGENCEEVFRKGISGSEDFFLIKL